MMRSIFGALFVIGSASAAAQTIPANGSRIYVGSSAAAPTVYSDRGASLLRLTGAPSATSAAVGDVTVDGFEDFVGLERDGSAVAVYDPVIGRVSRSFAFGGAGPGGVGVGDVDGDGVLDIVAVSDSGAGIRVFDMFDKDLRLGGRGVSAAVADVDGGATAEIVTLESDGTIVVRTGAGRILFSRSTSIGPQGAVAAGDLDGDGRANEFVVVADVGFAGIAIVDSAGRVTRPSGRGRSVAIGDVDNDGRNEIVVGESDGSVTVRDATGRILRSFTAPGAGATVAVGGVCAYSADEMTNRDGDALPDQWESPGIDWNGDCRVDFSPGAFWSADPGKRDLFVEVDYMDCAVAGGDCAAGAHSHAMKPEAIGLARDMFARAPNRNPDGTTGTVLHIYVDEALRHRMNCLWDCFNEIKLANFGERAERDLRDGPLRAVRRMKRQFFHYALFVHDKNAGNTSSGVAELPGNDFIVSLGSWASQVGTALDQAGTFVHELGHNLNLLHGGGQNENCKPNYLSVMSYTFQTSGLQPGAVLDYSRTALATLNEGALDETRGIGPQPFLAFWGPVSNVDDVDQFGDGMLNDDLGAGRGDRPLDWNFDRSATGTRVTGDVNNLGFSGCSGDGSDLRGFDDWAMVARGIDIRGFDGMGVSGGAAPRSGGELRYEDAVKLRAMMARAMKKPVLDSPILRDLGAKGALDQGRRTLPQGQDRQIAPQSPQQPTVPTDPQGATAPNPAPSPGVNRQGAEAMKDQQSRIASGRVDLKQTYTLDLDTGRSPGGADADLWFEAKTPTARALTPRNGALMAIVKSLSPGRDGCLKAALSSKSAPLETLRDGDFICVRTNIGAIAEVRIVGAPGVVLPLAFTTWRP